jgi:uncharacterized protein YggE
MDRMLLLTRKKFIGRETPPLETCQTLHMASVIVRGTAAASVTPDFAELTLEISQRAADAASALDGAATRSQQLVALLDSHGIAAADRATAGVSVNEEYEYRDNQQVLVGHRATTAITVTVRSTDLVGRIVRDAVGDSGAAVRNLLWRVDRANPMHAELLSDAARDARRRATAYAEALMLRLGEVELISETPIAAEPLAARGVMMAMDAAPMAKGGAMAVSEGLVELTADVHVRFALLN